MGKKPSCFKQYSIKSFYLPEFCKKCLVYDKCKNAEIRETIRVYAAPRVKVLTVLLALFGILLLLEHYVIALFLGTFVIAYWYTVYKRGLQQIGKLNYQIK